MTVWTGEVTGSGIGSLSILPATLSVATAAFSEGSSLRGSATLLFISSGTFSSAGSLSAAAKVFIFNNSTTFLGSSGLLVSADIYTTNSAIFNSSSSIAATFMAILSGNIMIPGAGRMCAYAQIRVGTVGAISNIRVAGSGATNNVVI